MTLIQDRYASAIHSSNLKSRFETTHSDSDVIGAYGFADRRLSSGKGPGDEVHFSKHPLAVPLERLFSGDKTVATEIVRIMAEIVRGKARALRIDMTQVQASDMARVMLGWFRHPACRVCGGHGFKIIKNTKTLGDMRCRSCAGTGKVQLELEYRVEQRELVRWAMTQIERESAMAGPAAMRALAPSFNL
jgi:DnaJ-class molecular chaperone